MSRRLELIFVLFMVSGFGGLIYESVWTHYLKLFLGHSAYAQTLVLVVFIGGLAIGAWICARMASRIANPLRWYAAAELAVGAMAIVFHPVFVGVTNWGYSTLLPAACAPEHSICAAQWILSALLLLPQSVLIGATFPLVSSAVLRLDPELPGHHVSMLYFLNSLGAVFGVLASIFVLIPAFGLHGTLAFAGLVNTVLAVGAFLLALRTPPAFAVTALPPATGGLEEPARRMLAILLATAFLTGLSSFIYEIVWIRMLSLVLGASTYSFELMLASFILGLALGGLWIRRRVDAIEDPVRFLGVVQVVMGVAAAATIPVYYGSFDFMAWLLGSVARNNGGFVLFNLASTSIALLVMLPATFCAGMTLPLITYRLLRSSSGERALGLVYSVNTLGSIAGVVLAVHLLMVWLGARNALLAGAAIDVALGVALIAYRVRGDSRHPATWAIPVGVIGLVIVAVAFPVDMRRSASGVFRTGLAHLLPATQVTYHKDGKTATVDIIDDKVLRAIRTNGKTDAAITVDPTKRPSTDELTMGLLAILPLAQAPQAKTAAVIGFGSGMSTDIMLRSPNIERVDTIEIEPAMVEGAHKFLPFVQRAFNDPRSHVILDDAKSYFARGRHRFDIIVSEPSNPWVSGVASLFTEEFYRRLAESLNDGGILSQWMHTYEMDAVTLASIFNALSKTFPDFIAYSSNEADIVIIARKGKPLGEPDLQVLRWPAMRPMVERLKLGDPAVLARRSFGTAASVLALFRPMGVPANSDYRPLVELRASKTRFTQERVMELTELQAAGMPLLEMFDGTFHPADHPVDALPATVPERAALDAWGFHDVIVNPSFVPPTSAPRSDSREHAARLIALWATDCAARIPFERLLPSMVTVAEVVNPHLAREVAMETWRVLDRSPCAQRLAPGERRWLDLFTAVAARDPAAMSRIGGELLEANRAGHDSRTQYAFEATVTGLVCQGRMAEANKLFEEGTRDWLAPGTAPMALRYLYSIANLPPGAPRPHGPICEAAKAAPAAALNPDATRSPGSPSRSKGK
ncbi:MAG TPA: fused MFS/spermidine synthase [Usitatibacter sp.]|jgi:predicted membrane-bound spermidine synthase|nr:fused MFS/spermidine synthase [Usitatibacter sp.]